MTEFERYCAGIRYDQLLARPASLMSQSDWDELDDLVKRLEEAERSDSVTRGP